MSHIIRNQIFNLQEGGIGISNWPTQNLLFALPATGVSLVVGTELTIYGDELVNVAVDNNLSVIYTCDIGNQVGNNFVINPVAENVGDHILTARFRNGGKLSDMQTITITVIAEVPSGSVNLLMIGDSTMMTGHVDIIGGQINNILNSAVITFIGTNGVPGHLYAEGNSGYTFKDYATGVPNTSVFRKTGVIDIAAYFADNTLPDADIIYFRVGINDVMGSTPVATTLGYIDSLLDAFLAYTVTSRIIIALPTTCINTRPKWDTDYPTGDQDAYIEQMHGFWLALTTRYANGAYNARVDMSYEVIHLNRDDAHYFNGVHLDGPGYTQLGQGLAPYVSRAISYKMIPTGLTLTLISGGVQIDWACVATNETEIWGKSDSGVYALLYTIAAGTVTKSEAVAPVDLRYYKLRAKNGTYFSDYCAEVSVAMLGIEKVTNGTFTAWTGNVPNGWSQLANDGTHYIENDAGVAKLTNASNVNFRMYQSINIIGETYKVKCTVTGRTTGNGYIGLNGNTAIGLLTNANGELSGTVVAAHAIFMVYFQDLTTGVKIDNVSCKKVLVP